MHILGALLAAIGVILAILWRMQQASHAARDVAETAGEAKGLFRSWMWRRKANVNPLDLVDDPREAAAVLMTAVAQADAAISERERASIETQMRERFDATPVQAEELLARARWLTRNATDAAEVMRRLTPVIRTRLGPKEQGELIAMLEAVAAADGRDDASVAQDIRRFAQSLRV